MRVFSDHKQAVVDKRLWAVRNLDFDCYVTVGYGSTVPRLYQSREGAQRAAKWAQAPSGDSKIIFVAVEIDIKDIDTCKN